MNFFEVRLDDISSMKYGKMPKKEILSDEGYPVYSGYRVTGYAKEYLFREPQLVVVARGVGGTGDVKISPPNSWITNLSIVLLLDSEKVNKHYLYYKLSREPLKEKLNTGAAQAQITIDNLSSYRITLPDLKTQKKIADLISAYDDLIENNKRRIALLEESARQLYKEWFVRFRFPGHEHVKIVDGVPEGWEKFTASQALHVNPKVAVEKGKEILYVPMASLSESQMTVDASKFERREKHTTVKFQKGDTLFARITPCIENGKTAYVNFLDEKDVACGSTEFIVLRGNKVSNQFAYLLAREESFRGNAIKSMIGSSGRQRVQSSCFDKYIVAVAPSAIQEQFDDVVELAFKQISVLVSQNNQLMKARDLLLPKLMSGELAV